jgi:hypothetical protein
MFRSLAVTLVALVVMGALAVPVQADTTAVSGTLTGTSTLTPTGTLGVYDETFTGSGVDSVSGPYTTTNTSTITFSNPTTFTSVGMFIDVLAGGTLFGTFTSKGNITGVDTSTITFDTVMGGTGAFAGDTGKITVIGTNTPSDTPPFNGNYTGFIVTAPEPSSVALMLLGVGLAFVLRKRIGHHPARPQAS